MVGRGTSLGEFPAFLGQEMASILWKKRVLVAEDSLLLADAICDVLVDLGFEPVGPVAMVAKAFELSSDDAFDAAVMDINLRDGNAFQFGRHLARQKLPFLFLTGSRREALPAEFRAAPVVPKPFEVTFLEAALRGLLGNVVSGGTCLGQTPDLHTPWLPHLAGTFPGTTLPNT